MEGDKRRTKDDTWKSDELMKHLKVSRSDSQSEDRRHRERKPRDRDGNDAEDCKGNSYKDPDKDRVKSKEKTGEKLRFKSIERQRDLRRDKGREKDHPGEREKEKLKGTHEKYAKEEKLSKGKGGEKHSGKERGKRHKTSDHNPPLVLNTAVDSGDKERDRDTEHHRRRESKDHADRPKVRDEARERRHSERTHEGSKNLGEASTHRDEEREHRHKSQKDHELDRDRKRRHRERKEQEKEKEKHLKERSLPSAEDRSSPRKHKERPPREDRHHKESPDPGWKEESERRKRDPKHREPKSQGESSKHEDKAGRPLERVSKEKVQILGKPEREAIKHEYYKRDDLAAAGLCLKRETSEVDQENELIKDITHSSYPDADYDNYSVDYEDDFEDYEDDFDDIDDEDYEEDEDTQQQNREEKEVEGQQLRKGPIAKNSEVEEIQKAINAENENVKNFFPKQKTKEIISKDYEKEQKAEKQHTPARRTSSGKFIDFQTARQRQSIRKIASQQKKRSFELLRLIDLDFSVSFCLLDLPPVNEYDMYIRNFGKINTKQAYVQWNEDNLDRDVQTEEIETQEKWTQHPGETALVSGGPKCNSDSSVLAPKIDSQRLASFLRSACQVIEVLLEEDQVATQPRRNLRSRPSSLTISDRCFQLNTSLPFLSERKVSCLHISQAQRQALLSLHGLPEQPSDLQHLDRKYIICVWNVWQPSSPQKILFCESQVACCCFSPSKATLVFAGTKDGSVLVWDLREDSRMHHCIRVNEIDWTFRFPTFSTDGVFALVNHTYPVLTIEPVSTSVFKEQNCGLSYLSSQEEMLGLSFQIASMDENGTLNLWVVVELQKGDFAGSPSDLGLIPGGKIKLVHSSTVQLNCNFPPKGTVCLGAPQTLNIKFLPSNPNHFVVGTDVALVSHGTRHELRIPPRWFKPRQAGPRSTRVSAIDFSPFGKPIFLVGCSDGSIRLHQITSELPLMQWNNSTMGQPIVDLQWALTRPAVFFVLDAMSVVYIWDLLENDLSPVAKQPILSDKVITMAVLGEPEKPNGLLGIALAKESGVIDIKYVKKRWALPQPEESEKLNLLLQQAL